MSIKREELKVGEQYSLGDVDNVFELLGEHKAMYWVEWIGDGEIETIYLERHNLKTINRLKKG